MRVTAAMAVVMVLIGSRSISKTINKEDSGNGMMVVGNSAGNRMGTGEKMCSLLFSFYVSR
jgi:hypothetical protein